MLPETMTSVTPPAGIAKIDSASGEPLASSAEVKRRTPAACSGWLTTNLQRWLSTGSAVMRISWSISGNLSPQGVYAKFADSQRSTSSGAIPFLAA